jgi:acyl-CoA hydrolase
VCLAIDGLQFSAPLFAGDWIDVAADVIYVGGSTMEIVVRVSKVGDTAAPCTHVGTFTVLNQYQSGLKRPIPVS